MLYAPPVAKIHSRRIKAARGYAGGIGAAELAKRIGVSESTVKRWEKGDPSLSVGYRIAIAKVCGVPPEFMENGWGALGPSEIQDLLTEQTELLYEIRAVTSPLKPLVDDARDGLRDGTQDHEGVARGPERRRTPPASS